MSLEGIHSFFQRNLKGRSEFTKTLVKYGFDDSERV